MNQAPIPHNETPIILHIHSARKRKSPPHFSISHTLSEIGKFLGIFVSITLLSLVILNFSAYNNIFQYFFEEPSLGDYNVPVPQIEPLYSEIEKENLPQILPDIMPTDDRIYIPRIDRNVPLVWPTSEYLEDENWQWLEDQLQKYLQDWVAHYPLTSKPGEKGLSVYTGHSSYFPWDPGKYKDVFALLEQVIPGDTIEVYYQGEKFIYEIFDTSTVKPEQVDILQKETEDEELTLITCTPVGTAINRFIVEARRVE